METTAAVFRSSDDARQAASDLLLAGFEKDRVNLLLPGAPEEQVHSIPTSDTEQPSTMGGAMGGVVGGAVGLAGGFELGVAASTLIPGVGPVLAVGIAAAALLGLGGAVGGAALGSAGDRKSTEGLPADEIFFYEDALRQGRSVLVAIADDKDGAERARELMAQDGAETMDAAREAWWIGLRDAEEEHYRTLGRDFQQDEKAYRAGFEAALRRDVRGRPLASAEDWLKTQYPDLCNSEAFRAGFRRGQEFEQRVNRE